MKEVVVHNGRAGASSYYDEVWNPDNAFRGDYLYGWHAGPRGSAPRPFPVLIWYEFRETFLPAEVSFRPRQDCATCVDLTPTKFQFIGTNDAICDDLSAWTILCEDLSDEAFETMYETRYCAVDAAASGQRKFRCLGLRILGNRNKEGWTSLNFIRMWERV